MSRFLAEFGADQSGATAVEYGIIACMMTAAVVAAIGALTPNLKTAFAVIASDFPTTP